MSEKIENLFVIARRAKENGDHASAVNYYEQILLEEPNSWEASFYVTFCKAYQCTMGDLDTAVEIVQKNAISSLWLISSQITDENEQVLAYRQLFCDTILFAATMYNATSHWFDSISLHIRHTFAKDYVAKVYACVECMYKLGDSLDIAFGHQEAANNGSLALWQQGMQWHNEILMWITRQEGHIITLKETFDKIRKYKPDFVEPELKVSARAEENKKFNAQLRAQENAPAPQNNTVAAPAPTTLERLMDEQSSARRKMILGIVFTGVATMITILGVLIFYLLILLALPFFGVGIPFLIIGLVKTPRAKRALQAERQRLANEETDSHDD